MVRQVVRQSTHHAAHEHLDGPHVGLLQVHLALPGGQAGQAQRIAQLILAGSLSTQVKGVIWLLWVELEHGNLHGLPEAELVRNARTWGMSILLPSMRNGTVPSPSSLRRLSSSFFDSTNRSLSTASTRNTMASTCIGQRHGIEQAIFRSSRAVHRRQADIPLGRDSMNVWLCTWVL